MSVLVRKANFTQNESPEKFHNVAVEKLDNTLPIDFGAEMFKVLFMFFHF